MRRRPRPFYCGFLALSLALSLVGLVGLNGLLLFYLSKHSCTETMEFELGCFFLVAAAVFVSLPVSYVRVWGGLGTLIGWFSHSFLCQSYGSFPAGCFVWVELLRLLSLRPLWYGGARVLAVVFP